MSDAAATTLEVCVENDAEFPAECSGCGKKMKVGEQYLTNIESCCGAGCVRSLCAQCVKWAAKELQ